jgi:hypothetical protein
MLMCCVCSFSLHRESPDMILGDKSLILEVVLSQDLDGRAEKHEKAMPDKDRGKRLTFK